MWKAVKCVEVQRERGACVHVGSFLGALWGPLEGLLRASWGLLGGLLGALGSLLEASGGLLGLLGRLLGALGTSWGALGPILAPSWPQEPTRPPKP